MGPIRIANAISSQYGENLSSLFASDLYVRNLPNYGIAAMLLILPGLVLAFRGSDSRLRLIATCWLLTAIVMQLISFREARYLAFLAPLSAMLIVPVVQVALRRNVTAIAIVALVVLDQYRGMAVAAGEITSTASVNVMRFINAPVGNGKVISSRLLSFVYSSASPLIRDRYHGIYHLTPELFERLYEGRLDVEFLADPRDPGLAGIAPGDRIFYSNNSMVRQPPWNEKNTPRDIGDFVMISGTAASMVLVLRNDRYEREDDDGRYVLFLPAAAVGQQMPSLTNGPLALGTAATLFGDIEEHDRLSVTGVIVDALCRGDSCSYR